MRKIKFILLLLAGICFFTCCERQPENVSKHYSVTWDRHPGYENTVVIFECNDVGDIIQNHSTSFKQGMTKTFTSQSTSTLEKIYDELRVIENNKSSFVIDSTYFNHIEELKTKIEGYKAIANDETLKKKERRSAEYSLQKYTTEKNVYEGVLEIVRYFMFMFNTNAFKR